MKHGTCPGAEDSGEAHHRAEPITLHLTAPVGFTSRRCPAQLTQRALKDPMMELLLMRDLAALGVLPGLLALVLAVLAATRPGS